MYKYLNDWNNKTSSLVVIIPGANADCNVFILVVSHFFFFFFGDLFEK